MVNGEPVAFFNRTVIKLPSYAGVSVETGSYSAVRAGGGKIKDDMWLGRVTVAIDEHLWIVEKWIEETMKEKIGYDFDDIVKGVQARMSKKTPEPGEETVQLDVFSAVVVNRMEEDIFVHKRPTSFPDSIA